MAIRALGRAILVSLVAALLAPISPVEGAPHGGFVTLTGRSSAYVDLTLHESIRLSPMTMTVDSKGAAAGYVLTEMTPADNVTIVSGAVAFPPARKVAKGMEPFVLADGLVRAGRYRLHLIADGPTRVRVRSTLAMSLKPRGHTEVESAFEKMGEGTGVMESQIPLKRKRQGLTLGGVLTVNENHQASSVEQCLLAGEEEMCNPKPNEWRTGDGMWVITTVGNPQSGWVLHSMTIGPRSVEPGAYRYYQRAGEAAVEGEHFALLIDIDLTAPPFRRKVRPQPPVTMTADYQFSNVDGVPYCGVNVGAYSCRSFEARSTDHFVDIDVVDAAGGPVAARVRYDGSKAKEICGATEKPLRVTPEEDVKVVAFAHPTAWCPTGHGTSGTMKFRFSATR